MNPRPILGLTLGDPAGVGPELCLQALGDAGVRRRCVPVLFGDARVIERIRSGVFKTHGRRRSPAGSPGRTVSLPEWEKLGRVREPLMVDCAAIDGRRFEPGKVSAACGRAGFVFIEQAIRSALKRQIDGVVTAPIHKEALRRAGVQYPGHTEIFTALTGARRTCMMLYSEVLTVSMVTTHIGYREVPEKLSVQRVQDVIELTAAAMQRIRRRPPRLAVCGLNPHAGEHGLFGQKEEERLVAPAVARARKAGIAVEGPLPPDAVFTPGQRKRFDAIVTLYHDQGHIPFKMLAFDTGVNLTLGLPIIRTSVDHGTAFDIAWQGKADPTSLFSAIRVAARLAKDRLSSGRPARPMLP
ncbi:MAG TPA: 4-hydroxythreonine-4-phosphate dehydrogenase PdxA [Candidatus Acidoferrum sp.]|nr:4-hydroxythreonine-4-phosphate dehydrogenase PdxA [Candidatus Acidoferrum sp.]